jgi:hypothetical protein
MPVKGSLLSAEEKDLILNLKREGKPIKEIMAITGRGHSIIEKYCGLYGLNTVRSKPPEWTEKEREIAINMYSLGKNYQQISKRLKTRSPMAVKIFLCRRRAQIIRDPEKIKVLKILSFCANPAVILKLARQSGFMEQLNREEQE